MVELLEELTLQSGPSSDTGDMQGGANASLSVDLDGTVEPADASRRHRPDAQAKIHLARIAPRKLIATVDRPLRVGDHYRVDFGEELRFEHAEDAVVRCTSCAESEATASSGFEVTLRPVGQPIDPRSALAIS